MWRLLAWCAAVATGLTLNASVLLAQSASSAQTVKEPDERMKTDILLVVAHPDDEGGVTPYLARAIYDEHKRVAVVFATRGGSGGNDYSREHGPALANIREQEARTACAKLGITNVWFLEGKDTASQNVLNSLANWGHGANLEALVRIVRLTRPEVIITWLPGVFIGENHGDHQAAGVLATEAFDLANDPTAFPAQVAGATKRLEVYLENLTPWQPKKLYYFSDADDQKQFAGTGPAYSIKEVSPSQKKPYWRLALDAGAPHLTQFPQVQEMQKMSEEQFNKFFEDPNNLFWPDPMTLTLGKSRVKSEVAADVFQGIGLQTGMLANEECKPFAEAVGPASPSKMTLAGPWGFYEAFRAKACLHVPVTKEPEIGIKAGTSLLVPLAIKRMAPKALAIVIEAKTSSGWKVVNGQGTFRLPEETETDLFVEIATPELSKEESKKSGAQEVVVRGTEGGKSIGEVKLKVLLKGSALAE
jgi:LmbE family N-acetylglucosaminyl deacetylase